MLWLCPDDALDGARENRGPSKLALLSAENMLISRASLSLEVGSQSEPSIEGQLIGAPRGIGVTSPLLGVWGLGTELFSCSRLRALGGPSCTRGE